MIFVCAVAIDIAQRRDGTVNRFVFSLVDRQASASALPDRSGVRSADVTVDAPRGVWARIFSPAKQADARPHPVVVYFHGSGFALFSAASAPFDAIPPVDLSRCFLAGDSAGGNIAHHVAQRWTTATASSSNPIRLAGVILLQAFFGGEERTEAELRLEGVAPAVNMRRCDWLWRAFLPEGADRNHPAAHVTGEAGPEPELPEGFPPALVVIGGLDPMQDWQRRYAAMLRRKGKAVRVIEFPEAIHAFYGFPELADAGKVLKDMKAFMDERNASG